MELHLLVGGVNHHGAAVGLHAGGVGGDLGHILQSGMDDMALVGVHGLQRGAAAGLENLLCLFAGVAAQLLPVSFFLPVPTQLSLLQ